MDMNLIIGYLPMLFGALAFLVLMFNSITIARGNEIVTLERRWFGKPMPDGRTVALKNEVGVQARILGPGFHFLIPFIYKVKKVKFLEIPAYKVGLVHAITGRPMDSGQIMAKEVDCDLFQDGEAFLKNGGQKGPQLQVLPEGEYKINPYLFEVTIQNAIIINEDEVGVVEAIAGKQVAREGGNFGSPVECDNFQDAAAFIKNGGQKGPQIAFLNPGVYRINRLLFQVTNLPITEIAGGTVGLVESMDGARIPEGRLLAKKVLGHNNFNDGEAFIKNGGEKGRQLDVLMPGRYRLNPMLFQVKKDTPWVSVGPDQVGIVTIKEGKPISIAGKIAADEIPSEIHNNFQDAAGFIEAGGQKGLQIPVLRAGNYAINPWFAHIELVEMIKVDIGFCGVVTSFVGEDGIDTTDDAVNAKIVRNGQKGIWAEPLQPGKHPLNTKICKVDIVPTTQILLNWADSRSTAHDLDSNLKTITLRTADAFNVNMDVSVIIHIPMANAPKVIANLGSVQLMISQVLEPAISSHFRNAAQTVNALDLYTKRAELQAKAKEHIINVLKAHHIDSKDTLIADVVLPTELTKTVSDRQIAEQEKKTFFTQKEAQESRRELENAKAQANMQPKVVESERQVEIEKNKAESSVKAAEGQKASQILIATGKAESVKIEAKGTAEAIKVTADANAEKTKKVGTAEAEIILAKGTSNAKAYQLEVDAMGQEIFGSIRIVKSLADGKLKLIPDNLVVSSGGNNAGGNDMMNSLFGISIIEKLTGRKFSDIEKEQLVKEGMTINEIANKAEKTVEQPIEVEIEQPKVKNLIKEDKPNI